MVFEIRLRVIKQEGTCAAGHKVGDEVLISYENNEIKGKICLHALYSILPKVFAMAYGAQFPWLEDQDISTHACPDYKNPVVFEVIREKR
ncbi:MAG: TIGR04076 family protein [Candidatus Heimdallarchaeaceae archaeon]